MNSTRSTSYIRSAAAALLCAGVVVLRPAAQEPVLPAMSFFDTSLRGETWPADFNGDGITDLVTSDLITVLPGHGDGTFGAPIASTESGMVLAVGDLNHDGRQDVVALIHSMISVLPGNGDGTLGSVRIVAPQGAAFASVADMDNDGTRDIVFGGVETEDALYVAPGNRDLTFDPPFAFAAGMWPSGHIVADLDNDGLRDIVVTHQDDRKVIVFHNGGAFAFTPLTLAVDLLSFDVTARDLNGDTRIDLAVTARDRVSPRSGPVEQSVIYVFLGNGDATFQAPLRFHAERGVHSIVAGDFTRDGKIDIATTNRSARFFDHNCGNGWQNTDSVSILAGRGDGTFGAPVSFAMDPNVGPAMQFQDVIGTLNTGDLNRDGHTDLITEAFVLFNAAPRANRPPVANAGEDRMTHDTDGVNVRGTGSDPDRHFLHFKWSEDAPRSGPLGPDDVSDVCLVPQSVGDNTFYFNVSDGYGPVVADDLVVTFEEPVTDFPAITITRPALNEVLTVGTSYTIDFDARGGTSGVREVDLFFTPTAGSGWTPIAECTDLPANASDCVWDSPGPLTERGEIMAIVTANNGFSTSAWSSRFRIRPADGSGGLPFEWTLDDIGDVGAAGSANYDNGAFTVRGSGADIWGTADEFLFVHREVIDDFELIARVVSVQNVNQWTKVGLMARNYLLADAGHASIFVTPTTTKGIAFQRRLTNGGSSLHTSGPALTAPVWLKLVRHGAWAGAYMRRTEADPWTEVGRQQMPHGFVGFVGLAVSSHVDGRLATAVFDNVSLRGLRGTAAIDVVAPGAGETVPLGQPYTIRWNATERLDYRRLDVFYSTGNTFQPVPGCTELPPTARSCTWTSPGPTSDSVRIMVDARGEEFIIARDISEPFRIVGPTAPAPTIDIVAPMTGEVVTAGRPYELRWTATNVTSHEFTALYSADDGVTWQTITECSALMSSDRSCRWNAPGPPSNSARLRIDVHTEEGTFASDEVRFRVVPAPPGSLPAGWTNRDIGAVAAAGSAGFDGTTFTVRGSGADIWGTADEFHYAYTTVGGDFEVTTRVAGVQNIDQWTKAGLMIRASTDAGSVHTSLIATPTSVKGFTLQKRATTGATSAGSGAVSVAPPVWLRMVREGATIIGAFRLTPTASWTVFWQEHMPNLPSTVLVGLAVTSHRDGTLATATFDNLRITAKHQAAVATIGAVSQTGNTFFNGVAWETEGSGADIWGAADAFKYVYFRWHGDGTITARVLSLENTNAWAKAGVMFRESLAAGSKHVMAIVSPGKGMAVQYRASTNGTSAQAGARAGAAPQWLRLTRKGNIFAASASADGTTWTDLGSATVAMNADTYVGLPVTSHDNTTLATAKFEDVTVEP